METIRDGRPAAATDAAAHTADHEQVSEVLMLMRRLGRLYRAMHAAVQPELEQLGLHPKEVMLLSAVSRGVTHPSQIGERIGTPPPTTSRLLERLAQAGLLRREADTGDLRRFRITLTPEGEQLLMQARQVVTGHLDGRFQQLPADTLRVALGALLPLEGPLGIRDRAGAKT